jgi:hypothetical protein
MMHSRKRVTTLLVVALIALGALSAGCGSNGGSGGGGGGTIPPASSGGSSSSGGGWA